MACGDPDPRAGLDTPAGHTVPDRIDLMSDLTVQAMFRALVLDPRNPHLVPALTDYFERAEMPEQAQLMRRFGYAVVALAKEIHPDLADPPE